MSDFRGHNDEVVGMPGWRWRASVLSVVAAGLVLRLPWPSVWWLNPDEGIYFTIITHARFAEFWADALATAHPPLYFLILRAVAFLSTDFAWLRSVAWLSGIALVYAFIVLGREVSGPGLRGRVAGLVTGLIVAASPRAIELSQVLRPYTLLLLLLAVALIFLLRALRQPSTVRLGVYATCVSLALTLHYSAVAALGVCWILVLVDGAVGGFRRGAWRRLALAQVFPALTLVALYRLHLRHLMSSTLADQALEGWVSVYLIHRPADVWAGLVGAHSSLVGDTLAPSAVLLLIFGLGWAAAKRHRTLLVLGGAGLAIAMLGAVVGVYPLGATRHASWLFVFIVPTLGWTLTTILMPEPATGGAGASERTAGWSPTRLIAAAMLVGLFVGAKPLSSILDSETRPREIAERVLQVAHVQAMSEVLSPVAPPRLVVMSLETYQLLAPLFVDARTAAESTSDGGILHVPWGQRHVFVLHSRDFTALPEQLSAPDHLYTAIRPATRTFGIDGPRDGEEVLILAGGWRSQGMEDLVELARVTPRLGTTTYVPGLIAAVLRFDAYQEALGVDGGSDIG